MVASGGDPSRVDPSVWPPTSPSNQRGPGFARHLGELLADKEDGHQLAQPRRQLSFDRGALSELGGGRPTSWVSPGLFGSEAIPCCTGRLPTKDTCPLRTFCPSRLFPIVLPYPPAASSNSESIDSVSSLARSSPNASQIRGPLRPWPPSILLLDSAACLCPRLTRDASLAAQAPTIWGCWKTGK